MRIKKTEHEEQATVIAWAKWNQHKYPELESLFAVPNQGKRGWYAQRKFKSEGMKAGIPDLCLPCKRGEYGALWIEMKTLDGKVTLPQQRFMKLLMRQGHLAVIAFSSEQAIKVLIDYLEMPV